jgi:hypothetical protein
LASLFGGYYVGVVATSVYERRWNSPLVLPLVLCFFFLGILCAPLIVAHITLVRFSTDIVSVGAHITSPTITCSVATIILGGRGSAHSYERSRHVLLTWLQQVVCHSPYLIVYVDLWGALEGCSSGLQSTNRFQQSCARCALASAQLETTTTDQSPCFANSGWCTDVLYYGLPNNCHRTNLSPY